MCIKTYLTLVICAVFLLILGGPVSAQSVSVDISPNSIVQGTSARVTMTFSGLPLNSNLGYRGYVSSQNFAACEGAGLGEIISFSTGNSGTLTRRGTISDTCPVGQYTLEVTLLTSGNATLAQTTVSFAVVKAIDPTVALGGAFQRFGNIGLVYRKLNPELSIEIWEITPESEGFFQLRVTQSQIDAVQPYGIVAHSPDGRAFVQVWQDRNVTLTLGPNPEGKYHQITLRGSLKGPIIETSDTLAHPLGIDTQTTTTGTTPAPSVVPFVVPQTAREDGSLIHVVQPGDTVHSIAFAYKVTAQIIIESNQLTDGGRWIYPGQELIIHTETSPKPEETAPEAEVVVVSPKPEEPSPEPREARAAPEVEPTPAATDEEVPEEYEAVAEEEEIVVEEECPETPSHTPETTSETQIIHVVQPGDTVSAIAVTHGVTAQAIVERNQLADGGHWIYPGQELIIPAAGPGGGNDPATAEDPCPETEPQLEETEPEEPQIEEPQNQRTGTAEPQITTRTGNRKPLNQSLWNRNRPYHHPLPPRSSTSFSPAIPSSAIAVHLWRQTAHRAHRSSGILRIIQEFANSRRRPLEVFSRSLRSHSSSPWQELAGDYGMLQWE